MLRIAFSEEERAAVVNTAVKKLCESGDLSWMSVLSGPLVQLTDEQQKMIHDAIFAQKDDFNVAKFILENPDNQVTADFTQRHAGRQLEKGEVRLLSINKHEDI